MNEQLKKLDLETNILRIYLIGMACMCLCNQKVTIIFSSSPHLDEWIEQIGRQSITEFTTSTLAHPKTFSSDLEISGIIVGQVFFSNIYFDEFVSIDWDSKLLIPKCSK